MLYGSKYCRKCVYVRWCVSIYTDCFYTTVVTRLRFSKSCALSPATTNIYVSLFSVQENNFLWYLGNGNTSKIYPGSFLNRMTKYGGCA